MIALTAESKCYGNTSQYVARITGRDAKFGYARQFTGKKDRGSTTAYVDEPGLYETCDIDKKGRKEQTFAVVIPRPTSCPDGQGEAAEFMRFWITDVDGAAIARRIDSGESVVDMIEVTRAADDSKYVYRLRAKGETKRASSAASIDAAVEHCWQVLQSFPEREAKKVLQALKARVTPPLPEKVQPAEAVEISEEQSSK